MTVVDEREVPGARPTAEVGYSIDQDRALALLLDALA